MIQNGNKNSFFIGKTEIAEGKKMTLTGMTSSEIKQMFMLSDTRKSGKGRNATSVSGLVHFQLMPFISVILYWLPKKPRKF